MQNKNTFFKVLTVRVIPMKVRETETKFKDLVITQKNTRGFLGAVFLNAGLSGSFMVCLRFSTRDELQNWENSKGNKELHNLLESEKAVILSEDFYDSHEYSTEFDSNSNEITISKNSSIPSYKMAIIIWISIFPLVAFALPLLNSFLQSILPGIFATMISTTLMVSAMVFILIPITTKLFSSWLNKK